MFLAGKRRRRPDSVAIWASALRAVTRIARHVSVSEADVIRAIAIELKRINLRGGVRLFDEDGMLRFTSITLDSPVVSALEKITGLSVRGYGFDPSTTPGVEEALREKRAIYSPDQRKMIEMALPEKLRPRVPAIMRLLGSRPVIVAPLIIADRVIGALDASGNWLHPDDCEMLMAIADHVAVSIDHARSRQEIVETLEREKLRNEVALTIASGLDLHEVLLRVIRLASQASGADAGAIALIDPERGDIYYPYITGLPQQLSTFRSPPGQGLAWRIVEQGAPIVLSNYADHPSALQNWVEAGVKSFAGVPLIVGEQPIGAMAIFLTSGKELFTDEQVGGAMAIASVSAIAIQNARNYSDLRQRAEESQALMRTTRSITASLVDEKMLKLIALEAMKLLDADGSSIHLLDPETQSMRCLIAEGSHAELLMSLTLEPGQGLVGVVAETSQPLVTNQPAADERSLLIPGTTEDEPECLALTPLQIRGQTIGVMTVRRDGNDRPFRKSHLELLSAFASQAAISLDNAQLFNEMQSQAQRLEKEVAARTHELSQSEARYRSLVENTIVGIFQTDTSGNLVYLNQAFADLMGSSIEAMLGKPPWAVGRLSKEDHERISARFSSRMQGERAEREVYELEMISSTGRRFPCIIAASAIADSNDNPLGVSVLVLDISRRKTLEAALRKERDRLNAILSSVGDAVIVTDPAGEIEYVNPAWEQLTGYSSHEAISSTPRLLKSDLNPAALYRDLWETITCGETWTGELINQHKDGSHYDVSMIIQPIVDETGAVINYVGVHHDISLLKEVDRLKTRFVSDASHELRTPLTNIRLYVDLLRDNRQLDKQEIYLQTLDRESERLSDLIDDLLSISRLESNAVPFDPKPVNITQLLESLLNDRQELAAERDIRLQSTLDPDLPLASGDRRLLTQVFTNLLSNAMNYSEPGGLVTFRTLPECQAERHGLRVDVTDYGLGIAEDELPLIFSRFFRGRASRLTKAPGTGLGLSICSEIVDLHQGKISVISSGENGTCFTVWLPAIS